MRVGDDNVVVATHKGSVTLQLNVQGRKRVVRFTDVYYYPEFERAKLLSIAQLVKKGLKFHLDDKDMLNFTYKKTRSLKL